ncbi:hypothetical protein WJX73_008544 [Symbiochloris irregularis]|uniref:glutamine synthetase n=1 Tax=Symbiochloris irregularis TaxID=706552 RepID=A0AAW1NYC3_9CHLO
MEAASQAAPQFSVEQQYTLLDAASLWPVGFREWRSTGDLAKSFSCGTGIGNVTGRDFAEAHLEACCRAGLSMTGLTAAAAPGQWSYNLGPCQGVELGDQLWLSRYILLRLTEQFKVIASLDPKPVPGDWCSSGAPVKYSTADTRNPAVGLHAVDAHIRCLQQNHLQHIMVCGPGNARRLTGLHKTSSAMLFTAAIEDRAASIRVPQSTVVRGCGYYEDRRPASNMDPWLVTMMLACTTLGIPLPLGLGMDKPREVSAQSSSDATTSCAGSSALIDEIDHNAVMGPSTPDDMPGALAHECAASEAHSLTGLKLSSH